MSERQLGAEINVTNADTEKHLIQGGQVDRKTARKFFGQQQFEQSMQHARDNNMVVAFSAVLNPKRQIIDCIIHKVPNDGKKRPLEYEAP